MARPTPPPAGPDRRPLLFVVGVLALLALLGAVISSLTSGEAPPEETAQRQETAAPLVAEAPQPATPPAQPKAKRTGAIPAGPAAPRIGHTAVKEIVSVGDTHRFTERTYDPPFLLAAHERMPKPATMSTPEDALASLTSAMRAGDWDWWIQLWDRPSRAYLASVLREQGVDKSRFLEIWKSVAVGQRFVATRRIDMPGYVILYSRRQSVSDDEVEAKSPLALRRDADGRWWFTHALREHPVFTYDLQGARDGIEVRDAQ